MNSKEIKQTIIGLISTMESNTFLLPDSWSDDMQMSTRDMSYKTYVGSRGAGRYINIVMSSPELNIEIDIRGEEITLDKMGLFQKRVQPKQVLELIQAIYNEKYSFRESAEGLTKLRKEIAEKRASINRNKSELLVLQKQVEDYLKLNKKEII